MPSGDKYIGLTSYLERLGQDSIKMAFEEIKKQIRTSSISHGFLRKW